MDGSFYICNKSEVIRKYAEWVKWLPRVQPHYAVKCNDDPVVLKTLAKLGSGFDCASPMEMDKVLGLGVSPSRIVFSHTTKILSHISAAKALGVKITTFDNCQELHKLKLLHPTCRLLLRFRQNDPEATFSFGAKFGAKMDSVEQLLTVAKELELNVVGVHFHIGSARKRTNGQAFVEGIANAAKIFAIAREHFGFQPNVLDIGGGFPGVATTSEFERIAQDITLALDQYFPQSTTMGTVIAEPGRYFVQSAFKLVTQIHSIRETKDLEGHKIHYDINDGIYGSFRDAHMENIMPKVRGMAPLDKESAPQFKSWVWARHAVHWTSSAQAPCCRSWKLATFFISTTWELTR